MTRPSADLVKVEWTNTGTTSPITLGTAVTGFNAFPSELDGLRVSYSIEHQASPEREAGIGVYTDSGTTLTRERVTASTNGGALVNFSSGTKHVRITARAEDVYENRATTDPSTEGRSQGYYAGRSFWYNTSTKKWWICLDDDDESSPSNAAWGRIATADEIGSLSIVDDSVTNAKLANMAAWTVKVRNDSSAGDPSDANAAAIATATPVAGAFSFGFLSSGALAKFDFGNLGSIGLPVADTTSLVKGSDDATKLWRVEVDGFTTGTTRVLIPADRNWSPTDYGEQLTEQPDVTTAREFLELGALATANDVTAPTDFSATGAPDATTVLLGNNTWAKIGQAQLNATGSGTSGRVLTDTGAGMAWQTPAAGGGGGGDGLTLVEDANTEIIIGENVTNTHRRLTSDTAITLILDAQTTVGTRVAVTKAGAGAVTVVVEAAGSPVGSPSTPGDAGYFVPGDDMGGSAATASFTVSGYAEFLCITNSDGNSAVFLVFGQTSLDQIVDADVDFTDQEISQIRLKDYVEVAPTASVSGAVTRSFADGNVHRLTLTGNVTSLTISDPPATGFQGTITFILTQDGTGGRTWADPSGTVVMGGAGTFNTLAGKRNVVTYTTSNGGSTWLRFFGGAQE